MRARLLTVLVVWLTISACGRAAPIPNEYLMLRVTAGVDEVGLGAGFPLTVTRIWDRELVPTDWDETLLAPLVVRHLGTDRREDKRHVEETFRYEAYAFSLGDVTVPGPPIIAEPRGGGATYNANGNRLHVRVRPTLDPAAPGPAELPAGPLTEPFPIGLAVGIGIVILAAGTFIATRFRRRAPAVEVVTGPPPIEPYVRALDRILALRGQSPERRPELQAWYLEASRLVRDYVGERWGLATAEWTTEECLSADPVARLSQCPDLADILTHCDIVKFGRHRPSPIRRTEMLDQAEAFVRETGTNGEGGQS